MSVTQQDLARLASVSKGAVSLALRNHPAISLRLRQRIQDLAREHGYRPHPAYSRMAHERVGQRGNAREPVALIGRKPFLKESPRQSETVWPPFAEQAEQRGLLPLFLHREELGHHPVRTLRNRGVRQVVFTYLNSDDPITELDWREHLVVCIGRGRQTLPFHTVRADLAAAARSAYRIMDARGYRRIGLAPLTMQEDFLDDRERLEGLISSCHACTGSWPVIPPLLTPLGPGLIEAARSWLREHRPDAVIGMNNLLLVAIQQEGWDIPFLGLVLPRKSTSSGFRVRFDQLAVEALGFLDRFRESPTFGLPPSPQEVLVRMEWQDGVTLPS